jgi:hypothetical protein
VRLWVDECAIIGDPNDFTPRTTLYESYKQWTYDTKHKPVRSTEFYDRLEGMGLNHTRRGNGTRGFEQIRLPKERCTAHETTA